MKKWFSTFLREPWVVLASWFVFVMFSVIVLPAVSFNAAEAGIRESIDTNFNFDPSTIYAIVESYGDTGRAYYVWQRWTFDLVWPILYGIPLFLTLNKLIPSLRWLKVSWLIPFPLWAVTFDYLENLTFTILVLEFPNVYTFLPYLGVLFSAIKWGLLTISMLFSLVVTIAFTVDYFTHFHTPKNS